MTHVFVVIILTTTAEKNLFQLMIKSSFAIDNSIFVRPLQLLFQFFDKTSDNAKLYKFPTSDCAILRQTQRTITVDESKASVIYTVFGKFKSPYMEMQLQLKIECYDAKKRQRADIK